MTGFSPLASSTLADDGGVINYELVASNIATQPASVSSTSLTQDHNLGVVSLVTGSPLLQTTSLTQAHNLTSIALLFGTPVLGGPSITQEHDLSVTSLVSGNPVAANLQFTQDHGLVVTSITTSNVVVPQVTMSEAETFSAPSLETGNPVVDNTGLTQDHNVQAQDVQALTPELIKPALSQDHDLDTADLTTSNPEVAQTTLVENYILLATSIVSGSPEVPDVVAVEQESFSAPALETGIPEVDNTTLTQVHALGARNILTPLPDLGEPVDPNAIVVQEIKEIEQMFGGWPRRAYEVPDGRLVQAEREIEALTGDRVSIDRKAKSLIKFGKSADLTADTLETVWTVGGNETYVTDNTIEYISSSSALDTQTIKLECHTVSGTGTDSKFTFLVQEVTLDGQNPVALDTPVARVSHAYNSNGTEIVGRVTVYENTTVVGGVPSDSSKIHIDIPQGLQGSFKGATTFSDSDYYVLTGGFGSVSKKQDANVDFYLEVREAGGVFIQRAAVSASTGGPWDIDLDPAVIVPKNADVRIRADSGTNNAVVFGVFKGYLAKVLG
jgi:hypothetical protein